MHDNGEMHLWDAHAGLLSGLGSGVFDPFFSQSGAVLLVRRSVDGRMLRVQIPSLKPVGSVGVSDLGNPLAVSISGDDRVIATLHESGLLKVFEIQTGNKRFEVHLPEN